jgi:hypothetical protein
MPGVGYKHIGPANLSTDGANGRVTSPCRQNHAKSGIQESCRIMIPPATGPDSSEARKFVRGPVVAAPQKSDRHREVTPPVDNSTQIRALTPPVNAVGGGRKAAKCAGIAEYRMDGLRVYPPGKGGSYV